MTKINKWLCIKRKCPFYSNLDPEFPCKYDDYLEDYGIVPLPECV